MTLAAAVITGVAALGGDYTTAIDNPYFPLRPGDVRAYRVTEPEGPTQRSVVRVTDATKRIANGVTARVVRTRVFEHGKVVERNTAWFAQDRAGNVWYLGEEAADGSWEAGVDGARAGVIMPAHPKVGLRYREEQAPGIAEDRGEVFSLRERVEVPYRLFRRRVLLIKETEGIERTLLDYKFYARGVGLVLGVEISAGAAREELVSFTRRFKHR
jgi:hypothetical protein